MLNFRGVNLAKRKLKPEWLSYNPTLVFSYMCIVCQCLCVCVCVSSFVSRTSMRTHHNMLKQKSTTISLKHTSTLIPYLCNPCNTQWQRSHIHFIIIYPHSPGFHEKFFTFPSTEKAPLEPPARRRTVGVTQVSTIMRIAKKQSKLNLGILVEDKIAIINRGRETNDQKNHIIGLLKICRVWKFQGVGVI